MISKLAVPGPIEDVDEMRVLMWHVEPGARFAAGAMLVELETHKAVVEVRAERAGVLRQILCEPGAWERVGKPLALVGDDDTEPLPASADALDALSVQFDVS
jgi:pyruvate/2-oxoglutarate dehydrogenase complex dihydrolipoamide acyltransferase (E2) component